MKRKKVLVSLLAVMLLCVMAVGVLTACNDGNDTPEKFTVTFKNGDTVNSTLTVDKDTALAANHIPTLSNVPAGKEFKGWYVGEGANAVKVEAGYVVTGNVTAVAKLEDKIVSITFTNDGDIVGTPLTNLVYGTELTAEQIPTLSDIPADKEFKGWFVDDGNGAVKVEAGYAVTGDVIAVAKLDTKQFKITYKYGDYVIRRSFDINTELTEDQILDITDKIPANKDFKFWYVEGDESVKIEAGYVVTSDVTALAKLEDKVAMFTVTFKNGDNESSFEVEYGTELAANQIPSVDNVPADKLFAGWFVTVAEESKVSIVKVDEGFTVTDDAIAVAKFNGKITDEEFYGTWGFKYRGDDDATFVISEDGIVFTCEGYDYFALDAIDIRKEGNLYVFTIPVVDGYALVDCEFYYDDEDNKVYFYDYYYDSEGEEYALNMLIDINSKFIGTWAGTYSEDNDPATLEITENGIIFTCKAWDFYSAEAKNIQVWSNGSYSGYTFVVTDDYDYDMSVTLFFDGDDLIFADDNNDYTFKQYVEGAIPEDWYGTWTFSYWDMTNKVDVTGEITISADSITIDGESCSMEDVVWNAKSDYSTWTFTIDGVEYVIDNDDVTYFEISCSAKGISYASVSAKTE